MSTAPYHRIVFVNERPELERLTTAESEVLEYIGCGYDNTEIAKELNIVEQTVKFHLSSVYKKLHIKNRTQAAIIYHIWCCGQEDEGDEA